MRKLLVLALVAACGSAGCADRTPQGAAEADGPVPVRTAPFQPGPVRRVTIVSGQLVARSEWDLAFKVPGVIASVKVREGDRVRRGEILAELELEEIAAMARQAREGLAKAARDRARARALREANSLPAAQADDAETAASIAEDAVALADDRVKHATLHAPADGFVDRRAAEPGEVVAPGRPVVHLSSSALQVRSQMAAREALRLSPGAAVAVTVDDLPELRLAGRVTAIARAAGRGTGTVQVDVALSGQELPSALRSGLTAKLEIEQVVAVAGAVPVGALLQADDGAASVFTVAQEKAHRVPVQIAFLQDGVAALSRVPAGLQTVVVEGQARLADGCSVRELR
ncbi:MAG TPA: efflux RND transporter periplasmic adaptor subunit [Myxococcales bacterium]